MDYSGIATSFLGERLEAARSGQPAACCLVGSTMRGYADAASDIDVMLVLSRSIDNAIARIFSLASTSLGKHFASFTIEKSTHCPIEITVKLFTYERVRNYFDRDEVIANYIFEKRSIMFDDIDFDNFVMNKRSMFESNTGLMLPHEIAKGRNYLYWLHLEPLRSYDENTRCSLFCEMIQSLARAYFLCRLSPYPYKKWLFRALESDSDTAALCKRASQILYESRSWSRKISDDMKVLYDDFLEIITAHNITGADVRKFEFSRSDYYEYLDW